MMPFTKEPRHVCREQKDHFLQFRLAIRSAQQRAICFEIRQPQVPQPPRQTRDGQPLLRFGQDDAGFIAQQPGQCAEGGIADHLARG